MSSSIEFMDADKMEELASIFTDVNIHNLTGMEFLKCLMKSL